MVWVINLTLQPLYLQERDPVPIVQEAGWASESIWTGAKISPPPGFYLSAVRPVASRNNDYAIP